MNRDFNTTEGPFKKKKSARQSYFGRELQNKDEVFDDLEEAAAEIKINYKITV
jgi:hypothetical protein